MTDEPEAQAASHKPEPQEEPNVTPGDQGGTETADSTPGQSEPAPTADAPVTPPVTDSTPHVTESAPPEPAAATEQPPVEPAPESAAPPEVSSEPAAAATEAPASPESPADSSASETPPASESTSAPADTPTPSTPEPAAAPSEDTSAATPEPVPATEPTAVAEPAAAPDPEPAPIETAEPAATSEPAPVETVAEPVAASEESDGDRPASRLREKLGAQSTDKPVGSEDLRNQRPDIPTNAEPVEIPTGDELDADLEAEISSALGGALETPATTAPAPSAEEQSEQQAADPQPPAEPEEIGPGSTIEGSIQHIHGDDVFLNAGLRSDVIVSLKQFPEGKPPTVGESLKVVIDSVDDDGLFRARLPQAKTKTGGNWDGLAVGQVVDCTVTGTNKGGLQISLSNLKGFLPASQVDLGYVSDLETYVGQKLTVQITEVKPKKRNLVVSRRAILQSERESQQAGFWESLEVGQDLTGTVKTMKNYGVFVNLGPIDGFLHIGEISWSRINHPNEVLKEGQEIQVRVLKIDREKNRISLGMKQLVQNPWTGLSDRYPSERVVSGKVTRVADFGAFVELEPGVEGLVHISQLAWRRVGSVNEVLKVGDEKEFQVLEVDQKRKRVSLSLKALEQKPESVRKAEAEEAARPVRKPNPDLRGGMGQNSGDGGLFGNPSDFT